MIDRIYEMKPASRCFSPGLERGSTERRAQVVQISQ